MSKFVRGPLIYILIIVLIVISAQYLSAPAAVQPDKLEYYEFLQKTSDADIKDIAIRDLDMYGRYANSTIPDENFPVTYDFSARIPSVNQLNMDLAAITGTQKDISFILSLFL